MAASAEWRSLPDLVGLLQQQHAGSSDGAGVKSSAYTLPSSETILSALQQRYKGELPYIYAGATNLIAVNPLRVLPDLSDASAAHYMDGSATAWEKQAEEGQPPQPHPYELAGRIYTSMQRTGKSQAVVFNGMSGSGKSYTASLLISQVLRVASAQAATSAHAASLKRVTRCVDQVKAAQVVLDAFGCAKTATTASATRQGRLLELHFSKDDNITSLLAGAKILTFGFDTSRLLAPLGKDERSFHVFYQLLAGATHQERDDYCLLDGPSDYDLLASSGTYRLPAGHGEDSTSFAELRDAFVVLGFKPKHTEMIYKILSAVLLLGNVQFSANEADPSQESVGIAAETHEAFANVCDLLGLPQEELEKALVNKTSYVRKEVVCALLDEAGAIKQRDSLMSALYAILFSYVVESTNHRVFPGDDAIKKLQRDSNGSSIVLLDIPGFQTKSPSGDLIGGNAGDRRSVGSMRRTTLIQAYGDNSYDQFTTNYANELVQHWLTRRTFNDDATDLTKRAVADGVKLPEVDQLDISEMVLELLRGGAIGSRADDKPGGLLGGLGKTASNFRKGKLATVELADSTFVEGLEERFNTHSRFIPRAGGLANTFAVKHNIGTVAYSAQHFVGRDLDLLDAEFVRLMRSVSSESFLSKLFSGPSLAVETHPRDPTVLVAAQISSKPLRQLSALKVSAASSIHSGSATPELQIGSVTHQLNETLTDTLASLNEIPVWTVTCLRPNDNALPGIFDLRRVKAQLDALDVRSIIARRRSELTVTYDFAEFAARYRSLGDLEDVGGDSVDGFLQRHGMQKSRDFALGSANIWLTFSSWKRLEGQLRSQDVTSLANKHATNRTMQDARQKEVHDFDEHTFPGLARAQTLDTLTGPYDRDAKGGYDNESSDDLIKHAGAAGGFAGMTPVLPYDSAVGGNLGPPNPAFTRQSQMSFAPSFGQMPQGHASEVWGAEWKGFGGQPESPLPTKEGVLEKEKKGTTVQEVPTSGARRAWLVLVWLLTWWIPTFMLTYIGRMKRPDIRIAWREKVALCMLVFLFCGALLFMILGLGQVLCPDRNKAWNVKELSYHQGTNDYYAAVAGQVYDLTGFYKAQHSDIVGLPVTTPDMMLLAGQDLTPYFPVPLVLGCPGLVTDNTVYLQSANFTPEVPGAVHTSGQMQSVQTSALHEADWYTSTFLPKMRGYRKGPLVFSTKDLANGYSQDNRIWGMYNKQVFDLSDYFYTATQMNNAQRYQFLPSALTDVFQENPGTDVTSAIDGISTSTLSSSDKATAMNCLQNVFYRGSSDFRTTPRCTVPDYFLLAFSVILIATIGIKFLAALQITKKRNPELQDKFVICQVPCYTEGEESLKKTIDSLANLKYDDKRKLLFVICDGMIVGSGNDRPTPRIVLDILGVENLDPDPLLFKSLGVGNKQLNYGKVYSGLYEFEGHVLPYIVVVKVGKPSERSRPGNRGKRDSQILLMRFLNRVHFDAEMAPLELEIYHQIKNVIGVDPKLYEFLLTVDADTEVKPDSLNRLVAVAADDKSIIGLCGETKLSNEQESWWTMIQVYEYYISHHLAKAFESLFGSVTCLPGCFTMFRLRTADKGRPLLVSNLVIDDYSENDVDTLHKKNLLHLGEDRYLTTLILKHFPLYKTKFAADARAMTVAPEKWNVLLSQRRRWINSTVHNLFELVALRDLCGFCCFSMRFVVLIDLLGTILLPATTVYLVYLIVSVSTHTAAVPLISLIMIGAVYGLQVVIFLLHRQWQFIGWLVIYILAFPVYSFFLPIYSFWHFDDFSWGNTRVVVGEGKNKKVLAGDDDHFDDSMIPMRKFEQYQQQAWDTQTKVAGHSPQPSEGGFSYAPQRTAHQSYATPAQYAAYSQAGSRPGSVANFPTGPQPAFSPFNQPFPGRHSPAGSVAGSEFGVARQSINPLAASRHQSTMSFGAGGFGAMSNLGMPNLNYAQPGSMTARNSSYSLAQWAGPGHQSSFSIASMNPFTDAHQARPQLGVAVDPANPTDDELVASLRTYLRTQDLLQVTKRSTREAMAQAFPCADLSNRKQYINTSIDSILAGQL